MLQIHRTRSDEAALRAIVVTIEAPGISTIGDGRLSEGQPRTPGTR
jgi:hypothetical protein